MAAEHPFVVTGAASGIGHATAARLIERGHRVLSLDVDTSLDAGAPSRPPWCVR
jgi:NAD(P)-dependent dehydrogenase (short-subunit alcohol dehydrogenase family)